MISPSSRLARRSSGIYWDDSILLVSGCTAVDRSCRLCWARSYSHRFEGKHPRGPFTFSPSCWNCRVFFNSERLSKLRASRPHYRRVIPFGFSVAVWNDLFHESVSLSDQLAALSVFSSLPSVNFLLLTKRPSLMRRALSSFSSSFNVSLPSNFWFGTSVSSSDEPSLSRLSSLLGLPVDPCRKFLSFAPVLSAFRLSDFVSPGLLSHVIFECQSGRGRVVLPVSDLDLILDSCASVGVSVFLKQWDFGSGVVKTGSLPSPYSTYSFLPWDVSDE